MASWFYFSGWIICIKIQISMSRDRVKLRTASIMEAIKTQLIQVKSILALSDPHWFK